MQVNQVHSSCLCGMLPVAGENSNNTRRRLLQVMTMLHHFNQPELWGLVAKQFFTDGDLSLAYVLSRDTLPHLTFLLSSGAASNITTLR